MPQQPGRLSAISGQPPDRHGAADELVSTGSFHPVDAQVRHRRCRRRSAASRSAAGRTWWSPAGAADRWVRRPAHPDRRRRARPPGRCLADDVEHVVALVEVVDPADEFDVVGTPGCVRSYRPGVPRHRLVRLGMVEGDRQVHLAHVKRHRLADRERVSGQVDERRASVASGSRTGSTLTSRERTPSTSSPRQPAAAACRAELWPADGPRAGRARSSAARPGLEQQMRVTGAADHEFAGNARGPRRGTTSDRGRQLGRAGAQISAPRQRSGVMRDRPATPRHARAAADASARASPARSRTVSPGRSCASAHGRRG